MIQADIDVLQRHQVLEHPARVLGRMAVHSHAAPISRVGDGVLIAYAPNMAESFRSAGYIERILKGADPAECAIGPPAPTVSCEY